LNFINISFSDVQWRITVNKNDAVEGGDFWLNLQIKHNEIDRALGLPAAPSENPQETGITRTLASATVDIEYTDALNHLKPLERVEFQGDLANVFSYTSRVTHSSDPLLYQVTITQGTLGVSGNEKEGNPPGFDVTTSWSTVAILKWQIVTATGTYIGIRDASLGTGFFKYYNAWHNRARDGFIESQNVSGEDLGDQSLPVLFSTVTATAEDGQATLKWVTETEVNNLGFFVYRGESKDGPFVKLNESIIPGAMSSSSLHDYEYTDMNVEVDHQYFYYIENLDTEGIKNSSKIVRVFVQNKKIPEKFALLQNFPNPFNPDTWIPYHLADLAEVTIRIYNVDGQLVKTLDLGKKPADFYISRKKAAYWDGRNNSGERVASGVYFYTLRVGSYNAIKRMLIIK